MKSENSFRKNMFGGFNSHDVVKYIKKKTNEHREEVEALRAGADKLRRERDALLTERGMAAGDGQVAVPPDTSEQDELRIQFYEMRKERDELHARLEATLSEREGERDASVRFVRERDAFESDRSAMLDTLTRREQEKAELVNERAAWCAERAELIEEKQQMLMQLEQAGATRERIEREEREAEERISLARSQAETIRGETARLIAQSRARFGEMTEKSRSTALEIVLELDRMRGFFARLPERFAEPEQILAQLENDPRPYVRAFVPTAFDEAAEALPAEAAE